MRRRNGSRWALLATGACLQLFMSIGATPAWAKPLPAAPRCSSTSTSPPLLAAAGSEEPGACAPRCRSGYFCRQKKCVSLCNPTCNANERCSERGECEPIVLRGPGRYNYFGMGFGYRAGLSKAAQGGGDIRLEIGGRYISAQFGPIFGDKIVSLRSALMGRVPFRPIAGVPFFLVPTISLGFLHTWIDDTSSTYSNDIFITPGLRLRYDPIPRIALFADLLQLEITFLRLTGDKTRDPSRDKVVPIHWNLSVGVAFLY